MHNVGNIYRIIRYSAALAVALLYLLNIPEEMFGQVAITIAAILLWTSLGKWGSLYENQKFARCQSTSGKTKQIRNINVLDHDKL